MEGQAILDAMVAEFASLSREYCESAIADGRIAINGEPTTPTYKLKVISCVVSVPGLSAADLQLLTGTRCNHTSNAPP